MNLFFFINTQGEENKKSEKKLSILQEFKPILHKNDLNN